MRTSGTDSDFALFVTPLVVLFILTVLLMGGPSEMLRIVDRVVREGLAWAASLVR